MPEGRSGSGPDISLKFRHFLTRASLKISIIEAKPDRPACLRFGGQQ